jgi:hypothetical protein
MSNGVIWTLACRSGSHLDPQCPEESRKLSAEAPHYLVIDTNVALHQVCMPGAVLGYS